MDRNAHLPGVSWVAGGGAGPCEVRAEVRLEGGVAEAAGGGEAHVVVVGHAPPPVQGAGGGGVKGGVRVGGQQVVRPLRVAEPARPIKKMRGPLFINVLLIN